MEATVQSTLMGVNDVAGFLGVSARQVWNLRSQGLLPEPVRLGRSSRWRRAELVAWIDAGCPALDEWTEIAKTADHEEKCHET